MSILYVIEYDVSNATDPDFDWVPGDKAEDYTTSKNKAQKRLKEVDHPGITASARISTYIRRDE